MLFETATEGRGRVTRRIAGGSSSSTVRVSDEMLLTLSKSVKLELEECLRFGRGRRCGKGSSRGGVCETDVEGVVLLNTLLHCSDGSWGVLSVQTVVPIDVFELEVQRGALFTCLDSMTVVDPTDVLHPGSLVSRELLSPETDLRKADVTVSNFAFGAGLFTTNGLILVLLEMLRRSLM